MCNITIVDRNSEEYANTKTSGNSDRPLFPNEGECDTAQATEGGLNGTSKFIAASDKTNIWHSHTASQLSVVCTHFVNVTKGLHKD